MIVSFRYAGDCGARGGLLAGGRIAVGARAGAMWLPATPVWTTRRHLWLTSSEALARSGRPGSTAGHDEARPSPPVTGVRVMEL